MVWAGATKIFGAAHFVDTVAAYDILPRLLITPVAVILPWLELFVGLGLLLGLWTRSNALLAVLLLSTFGLALIINLYRDVDISCGCFGVDPSRGSLNTALAQDSLLLALALMVLLSRHTPFSLDEYLL
jgi:uncharacterized membrane protein YphA (DoxX/SURF4 family)